MGAVAVEADEGTFVAVGFAVGASVGSAVGASVGTDVGSPVEGSKIDEGNTLRTKIRTFDVVLAEVSSLVSARESFFIIIKFAIGLLTT